MKRPEKRFLLGYAAAAVFTAALMATVALLLGHALLLCVLAEAAILCAWMTAGALQLVRYIRDKKENE